MKPTKEEIREWQRQVKDPNVGESVKEYYRDKLRKAGVKK